MYKLIIFSLISLSCYAIEFESKEKKTQLVELFTSQSCSSCPPAEKWLNQYKKSSQLWKEIVPIKFHVDYWNHLHWKDRFSSPRYTERQRQYNSVIQAGVYTPQVVLNGKDYRSWRSGNITSLNSKPGILRGKYENNKLEIVFNPKSSHQSLICVGVLMGGDYTTKIKSGENSGRTLKHEFVVLDYKSKKMKKNKNKYECSLTLKSDDKKSIGIWVSNAHTLEVIQATGQYLN